MIAIQIKSGPEVLSVLTDDHEDAELLWSDLEYIHNAQGGPLTATFKVRRVDPLAVQEDLADGNRIVIWANSVDVWWGDIESAERSIEDDAYFDVSCVGDSGRLKRLGTLADYDLDLTAGEKVSEWLVRVPLADADLGLGAGDIDGSDFEITTGLSFFPGKPYRECIDMGNEYNNYRLKVRNGLLDWQPKESTPTYFVEVELADKSTLNRGRQGMVNFVQMAYTGDGSIYGYVTAQNDDSIAAHGPTMAWEQMPGLASEAEAQQAADLLVAEKGNLKPSSAITTDIVLDEYGVQIPNEEVEAGKVLYVRDLLSTEEAFAAAQGINDNCTWEVAEVKIRPEDPCPVTLSPGDLPTELGVMFARIENRSRY